MEIKILCPTWGMEHLNCNAMLRKILKAGYDGIDTWIPRELSDKKTLFNFLSSHDLTLVTRQYRADGPTFNAFTRSFLQELKSCAEPAPVCFMSHGDTRFIRKFLGDIDER